MSTRVRERDRRPCAGIVCDLCVRRRRTRERRHGEEGCTRARGMLRRNVGSHHGRHDDVAAAVVASSVSTFLPHY